MRFVNLALLGLLTLSLPMACEGSPINGSAGSGGGPSGGTVNGSGGGATTCAPACQGGLVCDSSTNSCVQCVNNDPCPDGATCINKKCESGGGQGGEGGQGGQGGSLGEGGEATSSGGRTANGDCYPKVTLLLQRSGAMFEYPSGDVKWWDAISEALDSEDPGDLLDEYAAKLELGVTTFYMTEETPSCLLGASSSAVLEPDKLATFLADEEAAHDELLDDDVKVDAPVVAALDSAAQDLGATGQRYIILAVSGNPDSCSSRDGQCDTVGVVAKLRELRMAGIRTKVLFLRSTEIDGYPQALANAAAGRGVRNFVENLCETEFNFATNPMDASFGYPDSTDGVRPALAEILAQAASCE